MVANIEEIFTAALEKTGPGRAAYLDEACGNDADLRKRVEGLLRSHDDAGSFLETPATEPEATLIEDGTTAGDEHRTGGADDRTALLDIDESQLDFLEPTEKPDRIGVLGVYEIVNVIGRGGMGVVLKAHDPHLNRIVAVKTLAPEYANNAVARQRFAREAQAAAAVAHPHVVTIHAVEPGGRTPYLVMEYVKGLSLREKLDATGSLELREILRIGSQIAQGLAAAHGQGLIHRDVKPGNVLLENGVERVKLTDFGLARAADDVAITRTGEIAGTPQYMSPEQAEGNLVDHRSDLFSLGSVMYAMCTGRPPFRGDTAIAVLRKVCDSEPRPIREVNPDVPTWLVDIIDHLLAKDPQHRFQSAEEVARVLNEHLADLQNPSSGSRPKFERRLPKPGRSLPKWAATAMCLLVLVCGLGLTEATGVTKIVPTVIRIVRGDGTLVVEVDDPGVSVTIDGEEIVITGAGAKEIRLTPGQYTVKATKDGKRIAREIVTVERDGRQVVRISAESRSVADNGATDRLLKNEIRVVFDELKGNGVLKVDGVEFKQAEEGMLRIVETLRKKPGSVVVLDAGPNLDPNDPRDRMVIERVHTMLAATGTKVRLAPALQAAKENSIRLDERLNALRQLGIALHKYHEWKRRFPPHLHQNHPADYDSDLRPFLSWRVHLLPVLNMRPLYEQFHLNEPWDSPHNKPLLAKMPDLYRTGDDPAKTTFQMVVGNGTAYEGKDGLQLQDFRDGTSKTALVVDAGQGKAVPWTKPEDLPFDEDNPIRAFGKSDFGNEFLTVLADGSTKTIPYDIDPESLRALFTRAAGDRFDENAKRKTPLPQSLRPPDEITLVGKLTGHKSSGAGGRCLAVSKDRKFLLSCGGPKVMYWDLAERKLVRTLPGPKESVAGVALSADGKYAAGHAADGEVFIWDLETGKPKHVKSVGAKSSNAVAFSPDAKTVVAASSGGQGVAWDVQTGKQIAAHDFGVYWWDCLVRGDNETVLIAISNEVKSWNLKTGVVESKLKIRGASCASLSLSSDESRLLVGAKAFGMDEGRDNPRDHTVQVWSTANWREVQRFIGHTTTVTSVEFLPGERYILSGGSDGRIIIWDRQTGREVTRKENLGHLTNAVLPILDGRQAASFGQWYDVKDAPDPLADDYDIWLWNLPESVGPQQSAAAITLGRTLSAHLAPVSSVAAAGDWLVSAASDGSARVWNVKTGGVRQVLGGHHPKFRIVADVTRDGKRVVTGDWAGGIRFWEVGKQEPTSEADAHAEGVYHVSFSSDESRVLSTGCDKTAKLWDAETGKLLKVFTGHDTWVCDGAFSPDGKRIVTVSFDETARVWDVDSGEELFKLATVGEPQFAVAWSHNGKFIATGLRNNLVRLFDAGTGKEIRSFSGHEDRVQDVAFSPDDRWLYSGAYDRTLRVWNVNTGVEAAKLSHEHHVFNTLAVLPDGRRIATGGGIWKPDEGENHWVTEGDNAIRLWELPESTRP